MKYSYVAFMALASTASGVKLSSKGVPVWSKPTLMSNDMIDADLEQRNYVIDGMSGISFVQTKDETMPPSDDLVVLQVKGVPVYVNPHPLKNLMAEEPFEQNMKIGMDEFNYAQVGNPVVNPPYNNWSVNQPSVAHQHGMHGDEDLGMREIIVDGVNYDLVQLGNPVVNPPFNNWSVNQPSVAHQHGMKGDEDLGMREIIVDGVNYDI